MTRASATTLTLFLSITLAGCPAGSPDRAPPGKGREAAQAAPQGAAPQGARPKGAPAPAGREEGAEVAGAPVELPELADPLLRGWVESALNAPPAEFVAAAKQGVQPELFRYLHASRGHAGLFLREAWDPHRGAPGGTWTARAAPDQGGLDLLRCDYRVGGAPALLIEGRNFLLLQVTPREPLDAARLRALIAAVVEPQAPAEGRPGRDWRFEVPAGVDLARGRHCFTNQGAPPLDELLDRDQRADVIVVEGRVCFVFMKRVEQLAGFLPGAEWFEAGARRALGA